MTPLRKTVLACIAGALSIQLVTEDARGQQQAVPNAITLETEEEEIRRYSVELIIFEYAGTAANSAEFFPPEMPEESPADEQVEEIVLPEYRFEPLIVRPEDEAFQPLPGEELEEIPTHESRGFEMMDPEEYQLTAAFERLTTLDAYRPLMHTGWTQPTLEKDDTAPLKLRRIGDPPLRLNGTVSLYLSRFLHLVVDLALEDWKPVRMAPAVERLRGFGDARIQPGFAIDSASARQTTVYRIQEDRIMRNDEVRYFDHPKFGVIARITRIEEAEPDALDTTGDLLPGIAN